MSLTQLAPTLRGAARERIAKGKLPSAPPSRMWVAWGSGNVCDLCDRVIEPHDVEYEVQDDLNAAQTYVFHLACESLWELECDRRNYLQKHSSHQSEHYDDRIDAELAEGGNRRR